MKLSNFLSNVENKMNYFTRINNSIGNNKDNNINNYNKKLSLFSPIPEKITAEKCNCTSKFKKMKMKILQIRKTLKIQIIMKILVEMKIEMELKI